MTVEFVMLVPVLVLLMAVVIGGARVWWSRATVQQLASSAARQASISRTVSEAQTSAQALVAGDAASSGLTCGGAPPTLTLELAGFGAPVGEPSMVGARVSCDVQLSDLLLPFVGGSIRVEARASSPLDRFRARG